jgi:hypothetical protein
MMHACRVHQLVKYRLQLKLKRACIRQCMGCGPLHLLQVSEFVRSKVLLYTRTQLSDHVFTYQNIPNLNVIIPLIAILLLAFSDQST